MLHLGEDLTLALDTVTRKTAILGMTGSGKTSTAVVLVEEAARHDVPGAIIDPTGAWSGIASSADGQEPGVPVVIFGGDHADVPLEPAGGKLVAGLVADHAVPRALLDLSLLTRSDQLRVVAEFLDELYHLNRGACLVVVDEAHRFAPQNAGSSERGGYGARAHRALVDMVTMGRRKGLGVCVVCPRPAKLAKDVLELCDVLIAHRLRGTNDRKAVAAWLDDTDDDARPLEAELPGLPVGQALVSIPDVALAGVYAIRPKATFDSSATPAVGEAIVAPVARADVNLDAVRTAMSDAIERAEHEDPERLREQITRLQRELADAQHEGHDAGEARHDLEAMMDERNLSQSELDDIAALVGLQPDAPHGDVRDGVAKLVAAHAGYAALRRQVHDLGASVVEFGSGMQLLAGEHVPPVPHLPAPAPLDAPVVVNSRDEFDQHFGPRPDPSSRAPVPAPIPPADGTVGGPSAAPPPSPAPAEKPTDPPLKAGAMRMLTILDAYGPLSRDHLSTLAQVSQGGTMSQYLSALRNAGYIAEADKVVAITNAGSDRIEAGPRKGPMDSAEVAAMYAPKLKAGARRMLDVLMRAHPEGFTRKELAGLAGVAQGGTASQYLSSLRKRGLAEERARRVYAGTVLYLGEEPHA